MDALFGLILILIVGVITWCVSSEGVFGAGITFLCVLFAGLLAMNLFEPVAGMIEGTVSAAKNYADVIALVGLFTGLVFLFRLATDNIAPTEIEFDSRVYQAGRWLLALATGYTTMAFLLTALHTAPLPREFIGFAPEKRNLFDAAAPDRQWLGFVQHVTEKILPNRRIFDAWMVKIPEANQTVWPSFPIKYATRRDDLSRPGRPRTAAAPAATPVGTPTTGGQGPPPSSTAF